MVGMFTPWKSASSTHLDFFYFLESWLFKCIGTPLLEIHKSQTSVFCNQVTSLLHTTFYVLWLHFPKAEVCFEFPEPQKSGEKGAFSLFSLPRTQESMWCWVGCEGEMTPQCPRSSLPLNPRATRCVVSSLRTTFPRRLLRSPWARTLPPTLKFCLASKLPRRWVKGRSGCSDANVNKRGKNKTGQIWARRRKWWCFTSH